jgi:peptide-methionine (S)-S-oxide reductase
MSVGSIVMRVSFVFVSGGTMCLSILAAACATRHSGVTPSPAAGGASAESANYVITEADTAGFSQAIFAGGCFWCVEAAFEDVPGVNAVISGYVGGLERNPSYEEVSSGRTDHAEAVLVVFDPKLVSYEWLLGHFWLNHDPTTIDRQFCDRGRQVRPGIFCLTEEQSEQADASVAWAKRRARFQEPILTEVLPATAFWPAENHHQDFYRKNPLRYASYLLSCGRDARLEELWGSDEH